MWARPFRNVFFRRRDALKRSANAAVVLSTLYHHHRYYLTNTYCSSHISESSIDHFPPVLQNSQGLENYYRLLWKDIKDKIEWFIRLLWRSLTYFYLFPPLVLTAPLLLLEDEDYHEYWWRLLQETIVQGGPCFIKFAQYISTRPDLFPESLVERLKSLQSKKVTLSKADIENQLSTINSRAKVQLFLDRNGNPITMGQGCVATVVKAKMKDEENPVVIKMVIPSAKELIETDLQLFKLIANQLEYWIPSLQTIALSESTEEFRSMMLNQLDMTIEANYLEQFNKNFSSKKDDSAIANHLRRFGRKVLWVLANLGIVSEKNKETHDLNSISLNQSISFPKPFHLFTNENILVETIVDGELLRDAIPSMNDQSKKRVARLGLETILKMIFEDNLIHADLHPGNIFYKDVKAPATFFDHFGLTLEEETNTKLCIIDAGITVSLLPEDKRNLADLFSAIISNDGRLVAKLMIERSSANKFVDNNDGCVRSRVIDEDAFANEIEKIVREVHHQGLMLQKISVSSLMQKVLQLCYRHQVKLESRFASVVIAMGVVEGLGRQLDPELDILQVAAPYILHAALYDK